MGKMDLKILTKRDIEKIHRASIKTLEESGAQFLNTKALDYLEKYGCTVDRKTMIAKIPEKVVDEFMKRALPELKFYNRDMKRIPKKKAYLSTFGQGTFMTERDGTSHPSTAKDVERILIVGSKLKSLSMARSGVHARDLPEGSYGRLTLMSWNIMSDPEKAVSGGSIKMASVLAGGLDELRKKPSFIRGGVCPTSPLSWPGDGLDSMMRSAENGFATWAIGMLMAGATAPQSLAGSLVIQNSEMLSFEVFSQIVAYDAGYKGIPGQMGCSATTMDVRKGYCPVGNPEMALLNAASAELAQYYNCPNVAAGA